MHARHPVHDGFTHAGLPERIIIACDGHTEAHIPQLVQSPFK